MKFDFIEITTRFACYFDNTLKSTKSMANHYLSKGFVIVLFCFLCSSCGETEPEIDCNQVTIVLSLTSVKADCPDANGSISAVASGGSGNVQYSLDNQFFQDVSNFSNLDAGMYTVYARDENGCTTTNTIEVDNVSDISFTSSNTAAGCGGSDGSLILEASGGNGTYQYEIDAGGLQSSPEFNNVSNGLHQVVVQDGNGCQTTGEAYVRSGISFTDEIAIIVSTYCAVTGCHVAGEPQPDFTQFSVFQANAAEAKERTQSRNMPRGTTMSDELIDKIACWVDDGALNN